MFQQFLKNIIRNFRKHISYTVINIFGLAIGITCSLLIFIVIDFELSFDDFHSKKDRIYRINTNSVRPTGVIGIPATPYPIAEALRSEFSEIEEVALVRYDGAGEISIDHSEGIKEIQEETGVVVTNPSYFKIFDVKWIRGEPEVLSEPNTVVISHSLGTKYFGRLEVDQMVGQNLTLNESYVLKVAGIVADPPRNSDMPFTFYVSEATYKNEINYMEWGRIDYSIQHYLLLKPGADDKALEAKLPAMVQKRTNERFAKMMVNVLQPLSTFHFDTAFGNFNQRTVSKSTIYSLMIIGLVLLITACINFINLATAYATKRSKEVGIRKVLGSDRRHLIQYFLGETSVITVIALLLSVIFVYVFYPHMVEIIGFDPGLNLLQNDNLLMCIVGVVVFVIGASGIYPALLASAYRPVDVIKSNSTPKSGGLTVRRGLVILQFVISQVLIICTLIVTFQMEYFMNKDLGYNHESIINIRIPDVPGSFSKLENSLKGIPEVKSCSFSSSAASSSDRWISSYSFEGATENDRYIANIKYADENYIKTFEMDLVAGRSYEPSDTLNEIVINEKLAREMGINHPEDALGKSLHLGRSGNCKIVGVVGDFNLVSLHEPIEAAVIGCGIRNYRVANVKLYKDQIKGGISKIQAAWTELYPNESFEYEFLDETLAAFYVTEQRISSLFRIFAIVAIFIGSLGLYGLISFIANQRIKEVGIRKVLGASVVRIMMLFSMEFIRLVFIAFVIAAPISYYFMTEWLSGFNYRINIGIGVFVGGITASILVALMTMSYRSYVSATTNPVQTLRNE